MKQSLKVVVVNGKPETVTQEEYEEHYLDRAINKASEIIERKMVPPIEVKLLARYCVLAKVNVESVYQFAEEMNELYKGETK